METRKPIRRIASFVCLCGLFLTVQGTAFGAPGDLTLASTDSLGVKGIGRSFVAHEALSGDGLKVTFSSSSTLAPRDRDGFFDVYVKDLDSGTTTLVSTSSTAKKSNGDSNEAAFSPDGTAVAFQTTGTNLDANDTDPLADIYVKDLASGSLTLASTSSAGVKGDGPSLSPALSSDGGIVAFTSFATNLDPNDTDSDLDVYVKDLASGTLSLASTSSAGIKGVGENASPILSADGTRVAFQSFANLTPNDTDENVDVYVKDLVSGSTTLASTNDAGVKADGSSGGPALSADGTKVSFVSTGTNLDSADTDSIHDVFVKDLVSGEVALASTSTGGTKGNDINFFTTGLSDDGTKVGFVSMATNLASGDDDAVLDVYVKDLTSGVLSLASTSSSGTKGNGNSDPAALSGDGARVAFGSSSTNLDPADDDPNEDAYVKELAELGPITVTIDIKQSSGRIPTYEVTIFSDVNIDATTVDVDSVCFGDAEAPNERDCTPIRSTFRDANGDGSLDIKLTFEAAQTGIDPGDTQACVTGETTSGVPFEGCGPI
jgi:hypothetical protein